MRLARITVANFRSFGAAQTFVFPDGPGLYQMVGINEAEPRLGANGAGKTTLWDALSWCVHGVTPSGLKGGDVCNWGAGKKTSVASVFEDDNGVEFTVARTWGPISFTLRTHDVIGANGDFDDVEDVDPKDPNNAVMQLLRLSEDPWLQSVLMAQGQPMFLDMKAEPQSALFSRVMGLDRWLDWSAGASRRAGDAENAVRRLEREQADAVGRLSVVSRGDMALRAKEWEAGRTRRADEIFAAYDPLLARRKALKAGLEELDEEVLNRRAFLQKAKNDAAPALLELEVSLGEVGWLTQEQADTAKAAEAAEALHENFDGGGDCPTCGHHLSKAELAETRTKYRKAAWTGRERAEKAVKALARAQDRVRTSRRAAEGLDTSLDIAHADLDVAVNNADDRRREIQRADADLDRYEEDAEKLAAEVNPFRGAADGQAHETADLQRLLAEIRGGLEGAEVQASLASFWVRGFKEVRLRQISEALTELEVEVNSCCAALGLVGWEIRFAVDRENKSGGVRSGFAVTVRSPGTDRDVPWAAWSGGEKQRLRVAANMGLADLIRSRTGADLGLEVWDEPTQGLHSGGVEDLLEALEARARNENRQIWLVDHRTHSFGGFAGGAVVTKTEGGSRIEPM